MKSINHILKTKEIPFENNEKKKSSLEINMPVDQEPGQKNREIQIGKIDQSIFKQVHPFLNSFYVDFCFKKNQNIYECIF